MRRTDDLNIPLAPSRRYSFEIIFALGCFAVAWLATGRPTNLHDVLVNGIIGGAGLWLFFSSRVWLKFEGHRNYLVYFLTLVIRIIGVLFFLKVLVPYVAKHI